MIMEETKMGEESMKKGLQIILILFILGICITGTFRLIVSKAGVEKRVESTSKIIENTEDDKNMEKEKKETEKGVWKKLDEMENGCLIAEVNDMILQDNWRYHINEVEITKKKGEWENEERDECKYDKDGNLENEYSFFKINITVKCVKECDRELALNSMQFLIMDKNGKDLYYSGPSTATLDKNVNAKDFFFVNLKKGESITTNIVAVVDDKYLSKDNYAALHINNTGMASQCIKPSDHCYIKLPVMGEES